MIDVLKAINDNQQVEDLFVDAFNACGPVLMMSIHVLAIICLPHNPDAFAQQVVRSPATENFKPEPSSQKMMQYLMDGILMRWRTIQRTQNIYDSSLYVRSEDHRQENQERQSRPRTRTETRTSSATSTRATSERTRLPATNRGQTSTAYRSNPRPSFSGSDISSMYGDDESVTFSQVSSASTSRERLRANSRQSRKPASWLPTTPKATRSRQQREESHESENAENAEDIPEETPEEIEEEQKSEQRQHKKKNKKKQRRQETMPSADEVEEHDEPKRKKKKKSPDEVEEDDQTKNNKKKKQRKNAFLQDLANDQIDVYQQLPTIKNN